MHPSRSPLHAIILAPASSVCPEVLALAWSRSSLCGFTLSTVRMALGTGLPRCLCTENGMCGWHCHPHGAVCFTLELRVHTGTLPGMVKKADAQAYALRSRCWRGL